MLLLLLRRRRRWWWAAQGFQQRSMMREAFTWRVGGAVEEEEGGKTLGRGLSLRWLKRKLCWSFPRCVHIWPRFCVYYSSSHNVFEETGKRMWWVRAREFQYKSRHVLMFFSAFALRA